ncbi:MAG: class I SAM-dependent methyltransferase [Thermodesulfobacteriota bacterium]
MPWMDRSAVPAAKQAAAGAAIYSRLVLAVYDVEVLWFEIPFAFKCPLRELTRFFNENVSARHLDVGVGTGYFLDHCRFPADRPVIHLLDLNKNSLEKTARRIRRYNPVAHQWNALEPPHLDLPVFDSISAMNFLHCLPVTLFDKEAVFKNLAPLLRKGGVFFGVTALGQGVSGGPLYRFFNALYNRLSVFSNLGDNMDDLETVLARNFSDYSIRRVGCMAFFRGVR